MKVTLEELSVFSCIAESASLTRAADKMDISISVLSRRLQKLESKLNCRLFQRTTRSLSLTQEGSHLLDQATEILSLTENLESYYLNNDQQQKGTIRIDAATPFTLHAIAPLIPGFSNHYPNIKVELVSNETVINLIERKVDLAIRIGDLEDSSLKAKKLGSTFRGIYASPAYIKKYGDPKAPNDLENHSCLGFTKPEKLNLWPFKGMDNGFIKINPKVLADSGETLRQLTLQGAGIACLSAFTVRRDIHEGRLIPLLEDYLLEIPIPVHVVYYSDKTVNNRVRYFIDYISEHLDLFI